MVRAKPGALASVPPWQQFYHPWTSYVPLFALANAGTSLSGASGTLTFFTNDHWRDGSYDTGALTAAILSTKATAATSRARPDRHNRSHSKA